MRFHNEGAVATPDTLLASARLLGIEPEAAIGTMRQMASTILDTWRRRFEQVGADADPVAKIEGAFKMARMVLDHKFEIQAPASRYARYR
ncbi:MAG: hypothetical protein H6R10_2599 [Rhodocyclaceae bacterium]|nr:hypothetical protein [Rhodocyclaceae bacterium]